MSHKGFSHIRVSESVSAHTAWLTTCSCRPLPRRRCNVLSWATQTAVSRGRFEAYASGDDSVPKTKGDKDTELIVRLERRGSGWGEEILPHLVIEKRELERPKRRRRKRDDNPDPWEGMAWPRKPQQESWGVGPSSSPNRVSSATVKQLKKEGSLERFLEQHGVPVEQIEQIVIAAVAWRVTPGGRPLIDRRRRARVERNMHIVVGHLREHCGIPDGPDGVALLLRRFPKVLLCKPTAADRWDRRIVELAAFRHIHGHTNVPVHYTEMPELVTWVRRQRIAAAQGTLNEERQQMLASLGFIFGDFAQLTDEWENFFDLLLEWKMGVDAFSEQPFTWDLEQWGPMGGCRARQLAVWVSLQREFSRKELLPPEAVSRLNAIGFGWEQPPGAEDAWLRMFSLLIFKQEEAVQGKAIDIEDGVQSKPATIREKMAHERPNQNTLKSRWRRLLRQDDVPVEVWLRGDGPCCDDYDDDRSHAGAFPEFELEPGLGFWLAKQARLWRQRRLPRERAELLQEASIALDFYDDTAWLHMANSVASVLCGAEYTELAATIFPLDESAEDDDSVEHPAVPRAAEIPTPIQMQRWVLTQSASWQRNGLPQSRLRYLYVLGIAWVLSDDVIWMDDETWAEFFAELVEVKRRCGKPHVQRPGPLRDWLHQQRCLRHLNLLREDRFARLNDLKIDWLVERAEHDRLWEQRYQELLDFRRAHGHCLVPQRWEDNPSLGTWLCRQRRMIKSGELSATRYIQLKVAGVADVEHK